MKKGFIFVETIVVTAVLTVSLLTIYLTFSNVLSSEKRRVTFDDTGYMYKTYFIEDFIESLELKRYIKNYFYKEDGTRNSAIIRMFSCNEDSLLYNVSIYDAENNKITENPEYKNKKSICNELIGAGSKFNVNNIYITRYNLDAIKDCTTKAGSVKPYCFNDEVRVGLISLPVNMIYYLRSISSQNVSDEHDEFYYRLIVEYKESEQDTKDRLENNQCPKPDRYNAMSQADKMKTKRTRCCPAGYSLTDSSNHPTSNLGDSSAKCVKTVDKYYYNNVILIPRGDD